MRTLRFLLVGIPIAALAFAPTLAFHDGGVAHCNGCHTMHNSQNGVAMNGTALDANGDPTGGLAVGQGYDNLLLFPNVNDVCLSCHAGNGSYHVWASNPLSPGPEHGAGNFVFLEEDNINDGHSGGSGSCDIICGVDNTDPLNPVDIPCGDVYECETAGGEWTFSNPILGGAAGHTLTSGIKGVTTDPYLSTAPGGTFPQADLSCASCHDPHGNGSFRLLYRTGQSYETDTVSITYNATITAKGMSLFGPAESNTNHNAYQSGYSAWCATCHTDFHQGWTANLIHPSGQPLTGGTALAYNQYRGSTDCANKPPTGANDPCGDGTSADAYLAAVPFEDDRAVLFVTNNAEGPTGSSRVACVTCHRAHASSGPDAGRWDFSVTGVEEDGHESASYKIPNPYAGDTSQRSLCNKCHSQDEYDTVMDFTP